MDIVLWDHGFWYIRRPHDSIENSGDTLRSMKRPIEGRTKAHANRPRFDTLFVKSNRIDRRHCIDIASVIRRIGGRKSHPDFHRVLASTFRLGTLDDHATIAHLAYPYQFGRQFVWTDDLDWSKERLI